MNPMKQRSVRFLAALGFGLLALALALTTPALAVDWSSRSFEVNGLPETNLAIPPTNTVKVETEQGRAPEAVSADYDVSVDKSPIGKAAPGLIFGYSLNIRNMGTQVANNVVITETLPPEVTYARFDSCMLLTPTVAGNVVVWQVGNVAPGLSTFANVYVTVTQGTAVGTVLTNVVRIATTDPDSNLANNIYTDTETVVAPGVDLSISKNVSGLRGAPGGDVVYSLSPSNGGTLPAANVVITDVLPPELSYLSHTASSYTTTVAGNTLVFVRKTPLGSGAGDSITIRARVNPAVAVGATITNVISIAGSDPDLDLNNNAYTNTFQIISPTINLGVGKSLGDTRGRAGQPINYQLNVNNGSNYTATGVVLTDTLPAGISFVSWSGSWGGTASGNLVGQITPTVAGNQIAWNFGTLPPGATAFLNLNGLISGTVPAGTILTNTAVITSAQPDSSPGNNSASSVVIVNTFCGPDAFGYRCRPNYFIWIDATSGTETGIHADDGGYGPYPIGFGFPFYGTTYTETYISTNGLVVFGSNSTSFSNVLIPTPGSPNNFLAPMWDDLYVCGPTSKIYTTQGGSPPNRYWVVEWNKVTRFGQQQANLTFEAVLYENGNILYQYKSLTGTLNSATVGIENAAGVVGTQYLYNEAGLGDNRAVLFVPPGGSFPPTIYLPLILK